MPGEAGGAFPTPLLCQRRLDPRKRQVARVGVETAWGRSGEQEALEQSSRADGLRKHVGFAVGPHEERGGQAIEQWEDQVEEGPCLFATGGDHSE